ncbi:transcriptional regulator GutM [Staphylococcus equorum]|uniref:transcriptional regulator GutM n=1 Tax=Staphylococcus equorum TaxID=246432 RepID=UPI002DB7EDF2|nr:transcriptional regulator GutM [Staphylococcus equorum]MEB7847972.1 transcriptional regulator GutM [Staphylococcus equorum]
MESFGFIIVLIGAVLLQAVTNYFHGRYYQRKIKTLTPRYSEGYLGVGIIKKALRPGKIAILVTKKDGTIQECNILTGAIVLSRFHNYKEYEGECIDAINWENKKHKMVVQDAIKKIQQQQGSINNLYTA